MTETAINDFIADVLVRYFRKAVSQSFDRPALDLRRSRDSLVRYWALSTPVRQFLSYLQHSHLELQAVLQHELFVDRDRIRGRIDASRTELLRLRTGQSGWTVSCMAARQFESGPNHLLSWVLGMVKAAATDIRVRLTDSTPLQSKSEEIVRLLDTVLRFELVKRVVSESWRMNRPGSKAVFEASRSRRNIYRYAAEAFIHLQEIEAGKEAALRKLFDDTVLGPAPIWMRFEIALGLSAVQALERSTGREAVLGDISGTNERPFAAIGHLALHWQTRTSLYKVPAQEPSELVTSKTLGRVGLAEGADRPDFVLVDTVANHVVALMEAKWFSHAIDEEPSPLRDAVIQLVRYSRGYREYSGMPSLIEASVIGLANSGSFSGAAGPSKPTILGAAEITQRGLDGWAASWKPSPVPLAA